MANLGGLAAEGMAFRIHDCEMEIDTSLIAASTSDALPQQDAMQGTSMACNISLNWWTVGSSLQAETYKIEAMLPEMK
jgi:hypothetical protein